MTRARGRALLLLATLIVAGSIAFSHLKSGPSPLPGRPPAERPTLLLLTGLPLLFNDDFSLSGAGSPALKRLRTRYRVVPISVTNETELARGRLLLMAQPQAQTAENLVTLDAWVRGGGLVLLLADPMLEWPSKRPLGDILRPPPMFADTGLLAHWGLRLNAPDQRGPAARQLSVFRVTAISPGTLHGSCAITADRLAAECPVGNGKATIVADADFLNVPADVDPNLDGLLEELARLESK